MAFLYLDLLILSMRAFIKSHWRLVPLNWCRGNNLLSPAIVKIEWKEPVLQSVCGRDFLFLFFSINIEFLCLLGDGRSLTGHLSRLELQSIETLKHPKWPNAATKCFLNSKTFTRTQQSWISTAFGKCCFLQFYVKKQHKFKLLYLYFLLSNINLSRCKCKIEPNLIICG